MSLSAHLIEQFDAEIDASRRVIERITGSMLAWRPHEKSWTTLQLATHIANLVSWGSMIITTDGIDFESEEMKNWKPPTAETVEDVLGILESNAGQVRSVLTGMSDEALAAEWVMRGGDQIFATDSRQFAFSRWVIAHQSHHRGQLTVYLRENDIPLPGIFGPSADEPM